MTPPEPIGFAYGDEMEQSFSAFRGFSVFFREGLSGRTRLR